MRARILNSLIPNVLASIGNVETAHEAFKTINTMYGKSLAEERLTVYKKLINLRLKDGDYLAYQVEKALREFDCGDDDVLESWTHHFRQLYYGATTGKRAQSITSSLAKSKRGSVASNSPSKRRKAASGAAVSSLSPEGGVPLDPGPSEPPAAASPSHVEEEEADLL